MMLLGLFLLLAALGNAAAYLPGLQTLTPADAVLSSRASNGTTLVTAPSFTLQGAPLERAPANSSQECAAACTQDPECQWANFCERQVRVGSGRAARRPAAAGALPPGPCGLAVRWPVRAQRSTCGLPCDALQDGCADGSAGLGFQQCQLLSGNCTVWPLGVHGDNVTMTAGATEPPKGGGWITGQQRERRPPPGLLARWASANNDAQPPPPAPSQSLPSRPSPNTSQASPRCRRKAWRVQTLSAPAACCPGHAPLALSSMRCPSACG